MSVSAEFISYNNEESEQFVSEFFTDFEPEKIENINLLDSFADEDNTLVFVGDLTIEFPTKIRMLTDITFGTRSKTGGFSELSYSDFYHMDRDETYLNDHRGTFVWVNMTNIVKNTVDICVKFAALENDRYVEYGISATIDKLDTGTYKIKHDCVTVSFNAVHLDLIAAKEFLSGV